MSLFGTLFSRQPEALLGLDVGTSSLKLVELGQTKKGVWVLQKCAIEPLDHGWVVEGTIENLDEVVLALKRAIKKTGTRTKNAVMALAPSAIITKKMMVPAGLSDQELEAQVEAEANQYIPFALEEASFDFCIADSVANSQGDIQVLIAASRKEKVQDRLALAEAAGLRLTVVDVESYAARLALGRLIQELPNEMANAVVVLFEMGTQSTTMQVLRGDKVLYEREQPFGSGQLIKLIVRQYGLSVEEAVLKNRNGELPNDFKESVLNPFIANISAEMGRALQFFFTSTQHSRVDHIMLSGDVAHFVGLPKAVAQQTTFPCEFVNPFEGMQVANGVREKKLKNEAPAYLTACGLAMRRFLR